MFRQNGPWPILLLLLAAALATPASAERADVGAERCERAILEGARSEGVPESVLHAISLTETGRPQGGRLRPWPWAINREGQGYWFENRDEALAFAKASLAAGRTSFDVGCFQINYRYHGMNFPSLETMFEPSAGARYAAQFLRSLYRGNWSQAAGSYHSQTPARADVYRARFDRIFASLGGTPLAVTGAEPPLETSTEAPAAPKKSRTRLTRGPKIINVPKKTAPAPAEEAGLGAAGGPALRPIAAALAL